MKLVIWGKRGAGEFSCIYHMWCSTSKGGTLQMKLIKLSFDVLHLFLGCKMTPHKKWPKHSNFTIENGLKILFVFFIVFWMFSPVSKKAHSHYVPTFDALHHISTCTFYLYYQSLLSMVTIFSQKVNIQNNIVSWLRFKSLSNCHICSVRVRERESNYYPQGTSLQPLWGWFVACLGSVTLSFTYNFLTLLIRLRQFPFFLVALLGKLGHKTACPNLPKTYVLS